MKKIALFIIINLLLSCNTTPKPVSSYNGKNEIYPVIIKVFEKYNIYPKKIDIIKNEFTSNYIYQTNFGAKIRYQLKVNYQNNNIVIELLNIQQYSFNIDGWWYSESRLTHFDEYELPKKITDDINLILNNQKIYNQVKNEVYNNFLFHYLVIKDLPVIEKNNWIKNHMLGRSYNLYVTLSKFNKNKTGKSPDMKYIAEFTNAGESKFNDLFVINYFTNNEKYSNINNETQLNISGKLLPSNDIADLLIKSSHVFLVEN